MVNPYPMRIFDLEKWTYLFAFRVAVDVKETPVRHKIIRIISRAHIVSDQPSNKITMRGVNHVDQVQENLFICLIIARLARKMFEMCVHVSLCFI